MWYNTRMYVEIFFLKGGGVFSELVSKDYTQLLSLTQTVRGWCTVADMLV